MAENAAAATSRNPFAAKQFATWWAGCLLAGSGAGIQTVTVPLYIRDRVDFDVRGLAIGGALGTAAICTMQELLLVIIGGVFVMEALSVILQVASFKTRGKRIFAMSPIHHHFELRGWHESQVIVRFWILSIVFALGGLALLKIL